MLKEDITLETVDGIAVAEIRAQVERLGHDPLLTSSKRSIAFLKYVVEETLRGSADGIKERTIGIELYGRSPTYDTNTDHVVRTAALELRKRLAIYYGDPRHSGELRIALQPGSYVPHFCWPGETPYAAQPEDEADAPARAEHDRAATLPDGAAVPTARAGFRWWLVAVLLGVAALAVAGWAVRRGHGATPADAEHVFWGPLIQGNDPVLIAVGTARDGLPRASTGVDGAPLVIPGPAAPRYIPYADAVTTAKVAGELRAMGKAVQIRRAVDTTFSDLRQMPAVLVGAYDNPWTLRLMQGLRYSLEVDEKAQLVYIRDAKAPESRVWGWKNAPASSVAGAYGAPVVHDYALISRVHDARTGRAVLLIAGLEPYGTQVAGEFVTDPERLAALAQTLSLSDSRTLQIVLETTVTEGNPGASRVVAVSQE